MAYIGKTPITGNFVKLDAISVVNGQAGYTMNNGGSAFTDYENVNQFLVSLNGILQAPTDSFTVSGSTLTFASNLSTGDVIDFVIVLGNTLDIGTPSDATVTQAKTNFVSTSSSAGLQIKGDNTTAGTLQLNCEQNSHGIKLQSPPHSANQSYSLKFPSGNVTAGKFLKVDSVSGSGTTGVGTMTFADAGGGCWTHLLTQSASNSSSLDFSSTYITTTYLDYMLVCSGMKFASDDVYPRLLFSVDNGSNYLADYRNARMGLTDDNTNRNISQTGSSGLYMTHESAVGNSTGEGYNAIAFVFDPLKQSGTTDMYTMMRSFGSYTDTSAKIGTFSGANRNKVTTAVNNIRFDVNTGNITSGKVSLYGRKLS